MGQPEAVVVGSGPNGLAAAFELARAGLSVEVHEAAATPGGGCRTDALTLEGYRHDVCASVLSLHRMSPFLASLDLESLDVRLCAPPIAVAHPLDDGTAAAITGDVDATAAGLGSDAAVYRATMAPLVAHAAGLGALALGTQRGVPADRAVAARFGLTALRSAAHLARRFETTHGRALVAGLAAHSGLALTTPMTAGFALLLAVSAHDGGWPVVEGGSGALSDALCAELGRRGVVLHTSSRITDLAELAGAAAILLDTSPRAFVDLAGSRVASRERRQIERFGYGPGVCKVDWALSGPVPWTAEACRGAGTVHLGGTFEEVAAAEAAVLAGRHPDRPFVIAVQATVVDPTRAPGGRHTLWGYCHVPHGSPRDMTAAIEAQIERFAPGFGDVVLARATMTAPMLEARNPNLVGGDVSGGMSTLRQTLARPTARWDPHRTSVAGVYLCSASTPPGGGVHGMCGLHAATTALRAMGVASAS